MILKCATLVAFAMIMGLMPMAEVFAVEDSEEKVELHDSISFCKSNGCKSNRNSKKMGSADEGGDNTNYAGMAVWSDAELEAIQANQAIYEEAADKFGFPWPIMAVLHSHETGLQRYNPGNGQGVYQLYSYTNGGTNENSFPPADSISEEEFRRQTMIAAEIVSGMVGDLNDEGNVKRLFFQYNGVADVYIQKALDMGFSREEAENGEGSAYVMNRYDARRDPTTKEMDSAWPGRFVADGVYDSSATTDGFGAFVQYEALSGSSTCHGSGSIIADTALELSWEGWESHGTYDPKPEYEQAMKEVGTWDEYRGANCSGFVATVMRYSGADPDFPEYSVSQYERMASLTDMYVEIETEDYADLEPGDIFIMLSPGNVYRHVYLYVGEIDGEHYLADAAAHQWTAAHYPVTLLLDNIFYYYNGGTWKSHIFRRINL